MYSRKNNGVVVCRISRARTPNPRFWYDAFCLLTDSVFDCIGKTYRNPDIVLPKYKVAIFINGCFWHGHRGCKYATIPVNNHDFWQTKISGNVERDKINVAKLNEMGWRVIEIWQCQLKPKNNELTLSNLITELQNE